jgi:hypothetical protein
MGTAVGTAIKLKTDGTQGGYLSGSAGAFVISSSIGKSLDFDTNAGLLLFSKGGIAFMEISEAAGDSTFMQSSAGKDIKVDDLSGGQIARFDGGNMSFVVASNNALELRDTSTQMSSSASGNLQIVATTALETFTPSLNLKDDAVSSELRFYDIGQSNYVGFKAPALGANQIWQLPSADAAESGQSLTSNAAGVLSWSSVGSGGVQRGAFIVSSSIAARATKNLSSDGLTALAIGYDSSIDLTAGNASTMSQVLDIFVNGQLLVSGADGNANADYNIVAQASPGTIKFQFALEPDDLIQVIYRP